MAKPFMDFSAFFFFLSLILVTTLYSQLSDSFIHSVAICGVQSLDQALCTPGALLFLEGDTDIQAVDAHKVRLWWRGAQEREWLTLGLDSGMLSENRCHSSWILKD